MCIVALMAIGSLGAQKNISEMAKLFSEGSSGDLIVSDGTNQIQLEYWLKGGVLYKKSNDDLQSISLIDIDFSRETISQTASEILIPSKRKAFALGLSSKKPKKVAGMNLSFECVDDALMAFRYLKMKYENATNDLLLTNAFSSDLAEIVTSGETHFKTIKGNALSEKDSVNRFSTIQVEGALLTIVRPGLVEVDFGNFDNLEAAAVAFRTLVQHIGQVHTSCCRLEKTHHSATIEVNRSNIETWTVSVLDENAPDMMLSLILNENWIKLSIFLDVNTDED